MGSRSRGELGATSPRAARCHTLGWRQLACRARRGREAFAECPTPVIPERGEEGSAALTLTQAAATPRLSGTAPGSGRIPGDGEGEMWHPMGGLQRLLHPGEMRGAPAQGRLSQRCCPPPPTFGASWQSRCRLCISCSSPDGAFLLVYWSSPSRRIPAGSRSPRFLGTSCIH